MRRCNTFIVGNDDDDEANFLLHLLLIEDAPKSAYALIIALTCASLLLFVCTQTSLLLLPPHGRIKGQQAKAQVPAR